MLTTIWRPAVTTVLFAFLLANCGGGGGGGGGDESQNTDPNISLDTNNGSVVAANATQADDVTSDSSTLISLGVDPEYVIQDLTDVGKLVLRIAGPKADGPTIQSHPVSCDNPGGVINHSGGDNTGSFSFSKCLFGGVTFESGSFSYNLSGPIRFNFNNLALSSSMLSVAIGGDMNIDSANINGLEHSTISGSNLALSIGDHSFRLINYTLTENENNDGSITEEFDYVFESSLIGSGGVSNGRVWVTTADSEGGAPLITKTGDIYPSSGAIVIIGTSNSRVKVTAQADGVLIQFDENGDETYEIDKNVIMNWEAFVALASL